MRPESMATLEYPPPIPSTCHLIGGPDEGNESISPVSFETQSRFGPRQPGQEPECTSSPGGCTELLGFDSARGGVGIAGPESREPTQSQPRAPNRPTQARTSRNELVRCMRGSNDTRTSKKVERQKS